jgi:hypothetical protein
MPNPNKYKSVGVSIETYQKLLLLAEAERRSLGQQMSFLVDLRLEEVTLP